MKPQLLLASAAILAAAACSSSSSGGANATSAPPTIASDTTSASASPSSSPTTPSSPTPTPSFSSTVKASHPCATSQLALSLGAQQGAAGSTIVPIVFTNKGTDGCTLYGRPGVSFLDANGHQLGVGAVFGGDEAATVTLAPGAAANALLSIPDPGNFSAASCAAATAAKLRVYPPGQTASLTVAYSTSVCTTKAGAAMVNPVTPGSGGQ
ncbi:MAG TPA: DUF4232 domain-containing protein [Mycobacteriales bacterium]|nr:DUF4232 domain-containing protein [Mycobacteriales bacterium]